MSHKHHDENKKHHKLGDRVSGVGAHAGPGGVGAHVDVVPPVHVDRDERLMDVAERSVVIAEYLAPHVARVLDVWAESLTCNRSPISPTERVVDALPPTEKK